MEIVSDKRYQETITHAREALETIVSDRTDGITPVLNVLLRQKDGADKYQVTVVGFAELDENRKEMFYALGQRMADEVSNFIPVAVVFVSEAWQKKAKYEKEIDEIYANGQTLADQPDKEEVVVVTAMKLDGKGDMYTYPVTRDEDQTISLQEAKHFEMESPKEQALLASFFEGVAAQTVANVDSKKSE